MKICYIIGAGNLPLLYIKEGGFVIAADGGLDKLGAIKPNLVVGDFDSAISQIPDNAIILPVEKDVTDMCFAVGEGEKRGYDTFLIFGGTGGRPDHTFANISLLVSLAERGKQGYLIGDGYITTAIKNTRMYIEGKEGNTLSVFSAGDKSCGVTLSGVKYPLENHTLYFSNALGVSNSFTSDVANISVTDGILIVMWQEDNIANFVDKLK